MTQRHEEPVHESLILDALSSLLRPLNYTYKYSRKADGDP